MFTDAIKLLVQFDKLVYLNIANALEVAGYIVIIALVVGLPLGIITGMARFRFRRLVLYLLHLWMYVPALGIGIFLYYLQWGRFISPIGFILWGAALALPIVAGLTADVFTGGLQAAHEDALALGANRWQAYILLARQRREQLYGVITAAIARVFTEIGAFYLVISFLFRQGFPSKPVFVLTGAAPHLAVALAMFFFGIVVAAGLHFVQFKHEI